MTSPSFPDHYTYTFKYFLPVCMYALRVEQIKNTKTILGAFIYDSVGVYRRLCTVKNESNQLSTRFFAAPASTNAGRNKIKENKILNGYLVKEIIIMPKLNKLCLI